MSADFFERHLAAVPAMVILRGHDPETTVRLCRAAQGVALIEVPWHGEESTASLAAAVAWAREVPGVSVGAGTVVSLDVLDAVTALGAQFTVAPGFDARVAAASVERGLPHLPGVATATEVGTALAAGFRWQKAFPASVLTPAWFTALLAPFPGVRFVATGGVDAANARSFLDAGARAVSFGSSFTPEALSSLIS
ncbi:bifunctional 4-hydroxy-2-oxoglutarate aldolase/2-dehydro-3-deoxy-phosphogluconate aldolase [Lentzea sp. NPDC059081]|uniref:bifunctional 4-hydroxy-2-oxoglutarate aldolase/2-dehydro-3-deoxy-phosphogluconate aldolase n=1 Tax=Lentzea sp. NPDC059081 TaxID=3346719 RepID=UPI0036A510CE